LSDPLSRNARTYGYMALPRAARLVSFQTNRRYQPLLSPCCVSFSFDVTNTRCFLPTSSYAFDVRQFPSLQSLRFQCVCKNGNFMSDVINRCVNHFLHLPLSYGPPSYDLVLAQLRSPPLITQAVIHHHLPQSISEFACPIPLSSIV